MNSTIQFFSGVVNSFTAEFHKIESSMLKFDHSKWQTMQISGEKARYELSHLNLHCLQKPLIAFGSEKVK